MICKETDQCQWYSFNLATKTCITLETCDELDEADTDFTSGQVQCTADRSNFSEQTLATTGQRHQGYLNREVKSQPYSSKNA